METSQDSLFEQAMARYQAGAAAEEVLPDFARIVEAAPRQSAGWTCLHPSARITAKSVIFWV